MLFSIIQFIHMYFPYFDETRIFFSFKLFKYLIIVVFEIFNYFSISALIQNLFCIIISIIPFSTSLDIFKFSIIAVSHTVGSKESISALTSGLFN